MGMDRERGEGRVFAGRRVGCEGFGVVSDAKEEEERLAVMAGDVRRFGLVAARDGRDEVLHASRCKSERSAARQDDASE